MKEDFVVNPFVLKLSGIEIHFKARIRVADAVAKQPFHSPPVQ